MRTAQGTTASSVVCEREPDLAQTRASSAFRARQSADQALNDVDNENGQSLLNSSDGNRLSSWEDNPEFFWPSGLEIVPDQPETEDAYASPLQSSALPVAVR